MKTLSHVYREHRFPRRLAPLSICLTIMAAASNAAPVQSPLGVNATDDASLIAPSRLFASMPVFLAVDDAEQWSLPVLAPVRESDDDTQAPQPLLAAPDGAAKNHTLDLLPMLLAALEEERVDSAATSFGLPPSLAPRTLIAGHA